MPNVNGTDSRAEPPAAAYAIDGSMLYKKPARAGPTIALDVNVAVHSAMTLGKSSVLTINGKIARLLGVINASATPIPIATSTSTETAVEPELVNQMSTAIDSNLNNRKPAVTCRRSKRSAM